MANTSPNDIREGVLQKFTVPKGENNCNNKIIIKKLLLKYIFIKINYNIIIIIINMKN